jgi:chemotaxis protein histidine kinase CheA
LSFDPSEYADDFQRECEAHLQRLDSGIPDLPVRAADPTAIAGLFRSAHTIKGGARMMGYDHIGELADRVELVLDGVRRGQVRPDPATVDGLRAGVAALRQQIGALGREATSSLSTTALVERLEQLAGAGRAANSPPEARAGGASPPATAPAPRAPEEDSPFADPAVVEERLRRLLSTEYDALDASPRAAAPPLSPSPEAAVGPTTRAAPASLEPRQAATAQPPDAAERAAAVPPPELSEPASGTVRVAADGLDRIASLTGELLVRQRDVHHCVEQAHDIWGLVQAYDRAVASEDRELVAAAWATLRSTIARWQRAATRADQRVTTLAEELQQEIGRLRQ